MRIKVAILEKDKSYLTRIVSTFGTKYADKLELYSFTDADVALNTLEGARIDVLLASDSFEIGLNTLPKRCAFAYLVDSSGIDTVRNERAICKYQKADLIYKQILSVYSEKASSITGFKISEEESRIAAFCSASGGVGSSTMAAACALHFAKQGKKVLYLNLEKFGSADMFFSGQGQFDMSDIIFALKSKKTNFPIKLESCVKQDPHGVYFYSQTKNALDMQELNADDAVRLISELNLMGGYDYIILDMDFGVDENILKIYRQAQAIILVGDGTMESNAKTERAYSAIAIKEANADVPLTNRMAFVYNKVSSKFGQSINAPDLKILGGSPRYSGANLRQIADQLSEMTIFDKII